MLKLLRKYNKWILAIGGSLLMVVFLLPSLQGAGGTPASVPVARISGGTISAKDEQNALQELQFLRSLEPRLAAPFDMLYLRVGISNEGQESEVRPGLHWLMLTREAERQGFVGGPQDGRLFLFDAAGLIVADQYIRLAQFRDPDELREQMAQAQRAQHDLLEAARADFITRNGVPDRWVDEALAKARGVLRMYNAYLNFDQPGLPESVEIAQDYFDKATIDFFAIDAATRADQSFEPSDDEIAVQYALYKDVAPGTGEFGFGYRREEQVKLAWIRVSQQEVSDAVQVSAVDANERWRSDRVTYAGDFAAERERVIADIRRERTQAILADAETLIRAEMLKGQGGLTRGENGLLVLPEGWTGSDLGSIALEAGLKLQERHGESIPRPLVDDSGQFWLTRSGVGVLPVVSGATMQVGPRRVSLADLAFSVPEIDPEAPFRVQVGVLNGPLRVQPQGDLVFFRVTEAQPAGPPPLENVRGRIVEDLRRKAAFDDLINQQEQILGRVITEGMQAAADSFGTPLRKGTRVERRGMQVIAPNEAFGTRDIAPINTQAVRDAIIDRVLAIPVTVAMDRLPPRDLLVFVPQPERLTIVVAGIRDMERLSVESLRDVEETALNVEFRQKQSTFENWPFTPEALAERLDLRMITRGPAEEEDPAGEGAEQPAPAE